MKTPIELSVLITVLWFMAIVYFSLTENWIGLAISAGIMVTLPWTLLLVAIVYHRIKGDE